MNSRPHRLHINLLYACTTPRCKHHYAPSHTHTPRGVCHPPHCAGEGTPYRGCASSGVSAEPQRRNGGKGVGVSAPKAGE